MTNLKRFVLVLVFLGLGEPLQARTVQIWVDTSGSVDHDISTSTDEYLGNILTHTRGINRIEVYGFASGIDALRTPTATVDLSSVQEIPSCKKRKGEPIFSTVRRRHEAVCEADRERRQQDREKVLGSISRQVTGHLHSLEEKPSSRSTCLFQVLLRCSMQGPDQISIVISDGAQENCSMPPRPSAMGGAQIIVILVPKKGDNEEAVKLLEERSRKIRAFARVVVMPLFRMERDLPSLIGR